MLYALSAEDGAIRWQSRMRAMLNACPAVAGDLLLVGAGVRRRDSASTPELVAFGLP